MNSMSKLSISCNGHDLAEESGWTIYFEDFYANKTDGNIDDYDCDELNPSDPSPASSCLISDAASSAAAASKKMSNDYNDDQKLSILRPSLGQNSISKKLSFKKRRSTIGPVLVDEALEDTASSPVNSPKVSYLKEVMNVNPTEKQNINIFQGKGSSYGQVDDAMDFIGRGSDRS